MKLQCCRTYWQCCETSFDSKSTLCTHLYIRAIHPNRYLWLSLSQKNTSRTDETLEHYAKFLEIVFAIKVESANSWAAFEIEICIRKWILINANQNFLSTNNFLLYEPETFLVNSHWNETMMSVLIFGSNCFFNIFMKRTEAVL